MALTRKQLKAMGLTDEQVDSIIEAHTETVDGLKDQIAQYRTAAESQPDVQKKLEKAQADLEAVKKDSWKVKYDAIKEEFDGYKEGQTKKESRAAKEKAYRALLKEAGVSEKRIDAVLRVSDVDSVELDDKGAIKDAKERTKSIKEEWADFIGSVQDKGAGPADPPSSGGIPATRADIYKKDDKGRYIMSTADRQKALAEMFSE